MNMFMAEEGEGEEDDPEVEIPGNVGAEGLQGSEHLRKTAMTIAHAPG